jgi:Tol biopolymer transport system component
MKTSLRILSVFFSMVSVTFLASCNGREDGDGGFVPPKPPPISVDDFPFGNLGSGTILFERVGPEGKFNALYVIDLDQKKTWNFSLEGVSGDFLISPDGQSVVMTNNLNTITDNYSIFTCDINGKGLRKITTLAAENFSPSWSPDGSKIFFWNLASTTSTSYYSLYSITTSGNLTKILTDFSRTPGTPSISSTGKIAFVTNEGYGNPTNSAGIYFTNLAGEDLKRAIPLEFGRTYESPVFSPDGSKLAFLSVLRTSGTNTYEKVDVMMTDVATLSTKLLISVPAGGSQEWNFPTSRISMVNIAWSPDGGKLLFNVNKGDFNSFLFTVNPDGSNLAQITFEAGVSDRMGSWGK